MKKLLLSWVSIVVWICSPFSAAAQSGPALLRMERVQRGEAVCVLVQDDGSYRLEKLFRAKTEMYTGSLDSTRIERLRAMLDDDQLRKLSQENIHKPLITDTIDDLQFAILRNRGWQELMLHAPASRKPYKESIDPLLHWFQDLQRQLPAASRVEGSPTRCQPMPVTLLGTTIETSAPSQSAAGASGPAQYLFRVYSSHGYRATVDTTCTIVFANGSYRREHSIQSYLAARKDKVIDGQLEPEAIGKLKLVLASPGLAGIPSSPDDWDPRPRQEGMTTVLSIPRQGELQRLIFSTAFNTMGNPREIGGMSNMQYHVADPKLLEPLSGWMKFYTDRHDKVVERDAAGNDCVAAGADASGKGSAQ